jgi:hypothetical protein
LNSGALSSFHIESIMRILSTIKSSYFLLCQLWIHVGFVCRTANSIPAHTLYLAHNPDLQTWRTSCALMMTPTCYRQGVMCGRVLRRTCCASDGRVLNTEDAPIANANMTGEKSVVFQFGAVRKKNRLILPDVCSDGGLYHDSSIQVG